MAEKRESFFWTSYSDLMTSLFFIMLVLFVLVIVLLHKRMEVTENQLAEIKKVEMSTKDLSRDYFGYNPTYKKYVLRVHCQFKELHFNISELSPATRKQLQNAGKEIQQFLKKHKEYKYLLIVEGQASKNGPQWTDRNYSLSYARALSLIKFWQNDCGVDFGKNCEVQISGSGDGRYNVESMRMKKEVNNQRFLIHIIPKNIIEDE